MYLVHTRKLRLLYPNRTWLTNGDDRLHLTFDDGPHPDTTPQILALLDKASIRATFFCLGRQIEKHPDLYTQIIDQGHSVGNHTYSHLDGWATHIDDYMDDVGRCADICDSKFFRPPYGRITRKQERALLELGYQIVMWSLMPGDWDDELDLDVLQQRLAARQRDDIIVLHDQGKQRVVEVLTSIVQ